MKTLLSFPSTLVLLAHKCLNQFDIDLPTELYCFSETVEEQDCKRGSILCPPESVLDSLADSSVRASQTHVCKGGGLRYLRPPHGPVPKLQNYWLRKPVQSLAQGSVGCFHNYPQVWEAGKSQNHQELHSLWQKSKSSKGLALRKMTVGAQTICHVQGHRYWMLSVASRYNPEHHRERNPCALPDIYAHTNISNQLLYW